MSRIRNIVFAAGLFAGITMGPPRSFAEAGTTPVPAQARTVVVAFNAVDIEFDPHHSIFASEAQLFTAIYEGLFSYDPATLEPVKAACSAFSRSKDGLVYNFTIREGATWSDGTALKARDFRDAWIRALSPATKADYATFFDIIEGARDYRTGKLKDASKVGITTKGDKGLEVRLAAPTAYFTRLLCHHAFSPIHPSMISVTDWNARASFPVNGPFTLASRSSTGIMLEKNPRYWDADSVAIPGIRIILTDDDDDATARFDNGEIDWLAGPMNLDALLSKNAIHAGPMFGTQYLYFDCALSPFDSADLRRALALLLPWGDIRSKESYASPAETLVLPLEGYSEAKGIQAADADRAMKLLSDSGHADGKGIPKIRIAIPKGGEDSARVAGIIKTAWEKIGLEVEIVTIPSSTYVDKVRAGREGSGYTVALSTWIGDFADPLAFLQMWESQSSLNDARYVDAEYDKMLAESASLDGAKRFSALAKAETRLLASAACLPLHYSLALNVIDLDAIHGWSGNALDMHPFKALKIGQSRIRPGVVDALPGIGKASTDPNHS
ncbi:MAG: peptide ABC transporter substrate-binding protein [Spirochaetota bacterium]